MQKRSNSHFLQFTRKERNGILVLLSVLLMLLLLPRLFPLLIMDKSGNTINYSKEIELLNHMQEDSANQGDQTFTYGYTRNNKSNRRPTHYDNKLKGTLVPFDPNNLSAEGWKKFGLGDKTVQTIQNYLSKGGRFRQPSDIKKIWGLSESQVEQLLPYVRIERSTTTSKFKMVNSFERTHDHNSFDVEPVDVNLGDTNAWIALPGIGSKLTLRINQFREKLGGFYSVDQVSETFGLADSVFQKIRPYLLCRPGSLRKININTAGIEELKSHPYIRYQLANVIIQYRTQHGPFQSVDDIRKIMIITGTLFNKMSPYLTVD